MFFVSGELGPRVSVIYLNSMQVREIAVTSVVPKVSLSPWVL